MKSAGSISRELNQKIEHLTPEELGKYQIETEFSISRNVASGAWSNEEGDAELERIRQEVKLVTDAFSSSQYMGYREMYHHHAETELAVSYSQDLLRCYEVIDCLLQRCINYRSLLSHRSNDSVVSIYHEMLSDYQKKKDDIISSSFWIENHPPAAEAQS